MTYLLGRRSSSRCRCSTIFRRCSQAGRGKSEYDHIPTFATLAFISSSIKARARFRNRISHEAIEVGMVFTLFPIHHSPALANNNQRKAV